jgi:hypothetical protein
MSHPNNTNGQHVCFYSNRCKWSAAFIQSLKTTPFLNEFAFICVDTKPDGTRPQLPKWLQKVPTLVIKGENEPRTDNEVMNWLAEKRLLTEKNSVGGGATGEPEPWVGDEMGGSLTKGFSFLGDNDTNDAPQGDFAFLNGASAMSAKQAGDMPGGGLGARAQGQNKSKKEAEFDRKMESFMADRQRGMPQMQMRQ